MVVVLSLIFLHSVNSTLGINISDLRAVSECLKCPSQAPSIFQLCLNSGTSITILATFRGALYGESVYCVVCNILCLPEMWAFHPFQSVEQDLLWNWQQ